jgi:putative NIF3 family GTP cyclohydrolase 1 type 2
VLAGCRADLLLTGEMGHHEVLDFVHKGVTVVLTEHSNCERGYLSVVQGRLAAALGEGVAVLVSTVDRDPLAVV